jgi:hypothetical protein
MWASPFSVALLNLCGDVAAESSNFMGKDGAYEWLKNYSKQDFGYDSLAWEQWGLEHDEFFPGWAGIAAMMPKNED